MPKVQQPLLEKLQASPSILWLGPSLAHMPGWSGTSPGRRPAVATERLSDLPLPVGPLPLTL
ncbi:hypothetical protein M9458_009844 [Cirrhinus mrigala]|uniref:Uncharacterized protein n=1 Tax=Cirrhinus mrigala TaxID=683832 RepID=A0ABD0REK1_CIRMR